MPSPWLLFAVLDDHWPSVARSDYSRETGSGADGRVLPRSGHCCPFLIFTVATLLPLIAALGPKSNNCFQFKGFFFFFFFFAPTPGTSLTDCSRDDTPSWGSPGLPRLLSSD